MSTADLFEHLLEHHLDPFTECLTPDAARKIADFRADEKTQQRLSRREKSLVTLVGQLL